MAALGLGPYVPTDSLNSVFNEEFSQSLLLKAKLWDKYLLWLQVEPNEKNHK
jgi:hypothetical protein